MNTKDKSIVRDLALQVAEIAALPEQSRTIALWKSLNGLKPVRPMVLISPEGKIVYRELGSIDPLALKRAIQKALNERKPW